MGTAKTVNMHEAKTRLSSLVEEALAGGEIILARAGKPVVRLVPVRDAKKRKLGQWKNKVRMSDDFDAPLSADMLSAWAGKARKPSCG
jgi:prevent-host-death family protein